MGAGMARHQRRVRQPGDVVAALGVEVAEVDHDPERVAFAHQVAPRGGQPVAGVGRAREGEGHAMAVARRPRPDRPERAQPGRVPQMQRVEIGDRLGPFHVHDRGDAPRGDRPAQVGRGQAEIERPGPRQRQQRRRLGEGMGQGGLGGDRRGGRNAERRLGQAGEVVQVEAAVEDRHPDGEEPAGDAAGLHPREVEMPGAVPRPPERRAALRRHGHQPLEKVVVAVEDRDHAPTPCTPRPPLRAGADGLCRAAR